MLLLDAFLAAVLLVDSQAELMELFVVESCSSGLADDFPFDFLFRVSGGSSPSSDDMRGLEDPLPIAIDFDFLKTEIIELNEGAFHQGKGSVVRFTGKKR